MQGGDDLKQVWATVISNTEVLPRIYLVWLEAPQIAAKAQPGQFVMVRCGEGAEFLLRRPLSIHQQDGSKIALLFQVVGKGTDWLSQCKAGSKLDLFGPLGNSYTIHPASHNLLLMAGGIGIAPLYFLAQEAIRQKHSVTLLLGASIANRLYPRHLLPSGIELIIATDDGTAGKRGMLTDILPDIANLADQVFACGPTLMYQTMARQNQRLLKPIQISLEVRMGCGRGVCYGCTVRTQSGLKLVCEDGPVFNLDDIIWDELTYNHW